MKNWQAGKVTLCAVLLASSGCLRQYVIDSAAQALSASTGGGAFARDDDPELVAESLPFALKVMESLLEETPENRGLLTALAAGFTQYAQGFVLPRADDAQLREADLIQQRVKRLHLRAHRYGLRALEVRHPGFTAALVKDAGSAVSELDREDVEAMYWTGASLMAAIAISADDMSVVAELPRGEALMNRALELDPDWGLGALHEFFIAYEGRSEAMGGSPQRAQEHFVQAVELQGGTKASPYVALAEAVAVKQQDRELFERLLTQALAVDPDAAPEHRLANTIAQRRARWLRAHVEDLIL
ncbi:MAG: TRAP transporter TatT component family protein [Pseudomonadota bacterium]